MSFRISNLLNYSLTVATASHDDWPVQASLIGKSPLYTLALPCRTRRRQVYHAEFESDSGILT